MSLKRALVLPDQGPTLTPSLILTSLEAASPNTAILGVGASTCGFWGTHTFS